jgi:hypothetical protein
VPNSVLDVARDIWKIYEAQPLTLEGVCYRKLVNKI